MGLSYPPEWKFEGSGITVPREAVADFNEMILKIVSGSKSLVEEFKSAFGGLGSSSDYGWAIHDLSGLLDSAATNAATFVDSLWTMIEALQRRGIPVPSVKVVNAILSRHEVPLRVEPPNLVRVGGDAIAVTSAPSVSVPPAAPTYVLGVRVGSGGYGVVYRATRTTAAGDFTFALKVLDPSPFVQDKEKALRRFRREVAAVRSLQHRAIVPYHDAGFFSDGRPYVVMELVEGIDIRSASAEYPAADVRDLFVEVLGALEYAHRSNVIHRDLKPSNVLVRASDRQPVILDFGSAYVLDDMDSGTLTTQAVGTVGYIPSEVLSDPKLRSPLHDIYSCGVMLYESFARRRPDPGDYQPLSEGDPTLAPLDDVLRSAIAGAGRRLSSARAFADLLLALKL